MDEEFQLAKDLAIDGKGFALALTQESHQNELLDALRKTVKQLVSEYHTTETPITIGNTSAQRLFTVLSVIFKHGITDRYNGNLVNFYSLMRLNVPKSIVNAAAWFSDLEATHADATLARMLKLWLLKVLNEKLLYTHLSAVLLQNDVIAAWFRRDAMLRNPEITMLFIDHTALLDSVSFELQDAEPSPNGNAETGGLNVQRRRAKKTRVALIEDPSSSPASPSADKLELERQKTELEAQRARMEELEAQQRDSELKLREYELHQQQLALEKEKQTEELRLQREREAEEAQRMAKRIEEQVQAQLERERKLIEEAVLRQVAKEEAARARAKAEAEERKRMEEEALRVAAENHRLEVARLAAEQALLEEKKAAEEAARMEAERQQQREAEARELERQRLEVEAARRQLELERIERERVAAQEEAKRIEEERIRLAEAARIAAEREREREEKARIAAAEEAARLEDEKNRQREAELAAEMERLRLEAEAEAAREAAELARIEQEKIAAEEEAKRVEEELRRQKLAEEAELARKREEEAETARAAMEAALAEETARAAEEESKRIAAEKQRQLDLEEAELEKQRELAAEFARVEAERLLAQQEADRVKKEEEMRQQEMEDLEAATRIAEENEAHRLMTSLPSIQTHHEPDLGGRSEEADHKFAQHPDEPVLEEVHDAELAVLEVQRTSEQSLRAEGELNAQMDDKIVEEAQIESQVSASEEFRDMEEHSEADELARVEADRTAAESEAHRLEEQLRRQQHEATRQKAEDEAELERLRLEAEQQAIEKARLDQERLLAEEEAQRVEEEKRRQREAEEADLARRLEEEEEVARQAMEVARAEQERADAEEARRLEAERRRIEEEAERQAEAEKVRQAELARLAAEAELKRIEEETRQIEAEKVRQAEIARLAAEEEAKRIEEEKRQIEAEEAAKRLEAEHRIETARLEQERLIAEAKRKEEEMRTREAARVAAEAEALRIAAEEKAHRLEMERKAAEEEEKRKQDEEAARMARIQEEINKKVAAERLRIENEVRAQLEEEKRKQDEEVRLEEERKQREAEAKRKALEDEENNRAREAQLLLEARLEALKGRVPTQAARTQTSAQGRILEDSPAGGSGASNFQNPYAFRHTFSESLAKQSDTSPTKDDSPQQQHRPLASNPHPSLYSASPADGILSPAAIAATMGGFVKFSAPTGTENGAPSASSNTNVMFNRGFSRSGSPLSASTSVSSSTAPSASMTDAVTPSSSDSGAQLASSTAFNGQGFVATSSGNTPMEKPISFYTTVSLSSLNDPQQTAETPPSQPPSTKPSKPKPVTNPPPVLANADSLDDFDSLSSQDMEYVVEEYESMERDPTLPFVSPTLASTPKMTQEWVGPKRQIYFDIPERVPFDQLPLKVCAKCEQPLTTGLFGNSRYCHYSGRYYCKHCHAKDLVIIPAYVLRKWDFTPRPVCKFYCEFLGNMMDMPLYDPKAIDSSITEKIPALKKIQTMRIVLDYQHRYFIRSCRHKDALLAFVNQLFPGRFHLISDRLLSLQDLIDAHKGRLLEVLVTLAKLWTHHIMECTTCKSKGSYCEFCNSPEILYPFHLKHACVCPECKTVAHRKCFRPGACPRCKRLDRRQANQ